MVIASSGGAKTTNIPVTRGTLIAVNRFILLIRCHKRGFKIPCKITLVLTSIRRPTSQQPVQ